MASLADGARWRRHCLRRCQSHVAEFVVGSLRLIVRLADSRRAILSARGRSALRPSGGSVAGLRHLPRLRVRPAVTRGARPAAVVQIAFQNHGGGGLVNQGAAAGAGDALGDQALCGLDAGQALVPERPAARRPVSTGRGRIPAPFPPAGRPRRPETAAGRRRRRPPPARRRPAATAAVSRLRLPTRVSVTSGYAAISRASQTATPIRTSPTSRARKRMSVETGRAARAGSGTSAARSPRRCRSH